MPDPPTLGFAGFSGSGKTTLLCQLIPLLRQQGLRLGLIKHSHHSFEIDHPGKDSYLARQAGASQVIIASRQRTVVLSDHSTIVATDGHICLDTFLARLNAQPESALPLDLILVEGYKQAAIAKIEVHRPALGQPLLALTDQHIIAVACDTTPQQLPPQPLLNLNQTQTIKNFIVDYLQL